MRPRHPGGLSAIVIDNESLECKESRLSVVSMVDIITFANNILGQRVRLLLDGVATPGRNRIEWNGRDQSNQDVASGIYFCRLTVTDNSGKEIEASGKMMMIK